MTPEIEAHLNAHAKMKKKTIILNNFLGGLAWGVGSVLGATIVISLAFGLLRNFDFFIPGLSGLIDQAQEQRSVREMSK